MGRRHHDLVVWQEAIKFVKAIYEITSAFPPTSHGERSEGEKPPVAA